MIEHGRAGRQLNMGNPVEGLPVHANEKNVCHLFSAFFNERFKSVFDTFVMLYLLQCQLVTKFDVIKSLEIINPSFKKNLVYFSEISVTLLTSERAKSNVFLY